MCHCYYYIPLILFCVHVCVCVVFKNYIFCVSGVHLYLSEIVLCLFSVVIRPWCIFVCQWLFCVFLMFFCVFLVLFCVSSVHLCLWCIFVSLGLFVVPLWCCFVPLYILCVCLWSSFSILVIIQSELGQFNDMWFLVKSILLVKLMSRCLFMGSPFALCSQCLAITG